MSNLIFSSKRLLTEISKAISDTFIGEHVKLKPKAFSSWVSGRRLGIDNVYKETVGMVLTGATFANNAHIMQPLCGDQVENGQSVFFNCRNLVGSPAIGRNLVNCYRMYRDCWNLTGGKETYLLPPFLNEAAYIKTYYADAYGGIPLAQVPILNLSEMFYNCVKLDGSISVNTISPLLECHSAPISGEATPANVWGLTEEDMTPKFNNGDVIEAEGSYLFPKGGAVCGGYVPKSLLSYYRMNNNVGHANFNKTFFNCGNISGEFNPICGLVGKEIYILDLNQAFYNCVNLGKYNRVIEEEDKYLTVKYVWNYRIDGNPTGPVYREIERTVKVLVKNKFNLLPNLFNITYATSTYQAFYECQHLTGDAICSDVAADMSNMYYNCWSLDGNAACGQATTTLSECYYNCTNLKKAVCGPNVTTLKNTYFNCTNLVGYAVCGPKVTTMLNAYQNCHNIQSIRQIGNLVRDVRDAFRECHSLVGSAIMDFAVTYIANAFYNCRNLEGVYYQTGFNRSAAAHFVNAFYTPEPRVKRLNVVFNQKAYLTTCRAATVTGCEMTAEEAIDDTLIQLPLTYPNGRVYGYKNCIAKRMSYNEEYNIYMYSEQA